MCPEQLVQSLYGLCCVLEGVLYTIWSIYRPIAWKNVWNVRFSITTLGLQSGWNYVINSFNIFLFVKFVFDFLLSFLRIVLKL